MLSKSRLSVTPLLQTKDSILQLQPQQQQQQLYSRSRRINLKEGASSSSSSSFYHFSTSKGTKQHKSESLHKINLLLTTKRTTTTTQFKTSVVVIASGGVCNNHHQYRTYGQKVISGDELLSDIHRQVFSNIVYTTKFFHVAVDGYNQKKYEEATKFFSTVIKKGKAVIAISKNPPTKEFTIEKQIFWSLIYRGVITNSYKDLQNAKQMNPFHPEVFYRRGNLFYFENSFEYAIKDYSKAIANNPNYAECYFNRGLCHFQLKRYDRSIKDLEKYLETSPNDPNTLKILGISYYYECIMYDTSRRELLVKSIESLTRFIEYRKKNSLPISKEDYLTRGNALGELKQVELAQQDFQSAANSTIQTFTPPILITPVDCFTQERIEIDDLTFNVVV